MGGFEADLDLSKEESAQYEFKKQGFYPGIVVKFDIYHFAVNAIIKMLSHGEAINTDMEQDSESNRLLKNTLSCAPSVVRVLKGLCQRWHADAMMECKWTA